MKWALMNVLDDVSIFHGWMLAPYATDLFPLIYRAFLGCPNGESCTSNVCLKYCRTYGLHLMNFVGAELFETDLPNPHFNAVAHNNDGKKLAEIMNIDGIDFDDDDFVQTFRIEDPDGCPDMESDDDYYYDYFGFSD